MRKTIFKSSDKQKRSELPVMCIRGFMGNPKNSEQNISKVLNYSKNEKLKQLHKMNIR